MAAVAWSAETGADGHPRKVGCDIQYADLRRNHEGIVRRFFSPQERDYIAAAAESAEGRRRFYRIWVLKECFIKLRGLSVTDMEKTPAFCPGADPATTGSTTGSAVQAFTLWELDGGEGSYFLAAALEGPSPVSPLLRWFSEASLPVRSMEEIKAVVSPANTATPKR
jgi:hypothetical protein